MNTDEASGMVLIPAYHEAGRIGRVVTAVRACFPGPVVVIDDGSGDATAEEAEQAGAVVLRHAVNQGKGAALVTGFEHARREGAAFVITMDADGQHAAADLPGFLERFQAGDTDVIVGNRMADPAGMPLVRRLTNRFMSALLSRQMGQSVPDTQNGFRLYRTTVLPAPSPDESGGFAAESEILLRLAARGVRIAAVPVRVIYGDERSKIRPFRDTVRFFRMLRRWKAGGEGRELSKVLRKRMRR